MHILIQNPPKPRWTDQYKKGFCRKTVNWLFHDRKATQLFLQQSRMSTHNHSCRRAHAASHCRHILTPTIVWFLGKLSFSHSSIEASQQSGLIWVCSLIKPKNPCLNKAIYEGGVKDKSSVLSSMSWINTRLHDTINRLPSKSILRCHIVVSWAQSAFKTKSHDLVPDCSAVWEGKLTISGIMMPSVGVCCSPGDFTQGADSWATEKHI